jgi:hypothetical protein
MNNSSLLTGALVFAFILFLASRNRLGTYAAVVWGKPSGGDSSSSASGATPSVSSPNAVGTSAAPSATPAKTSGTMTPNPGTAIDVLKNAYVQMGGGIATQDFSTALHLATDLAAFGF